MKAAELRRQVRRGLLASAGIVGIPLALLIALQLVCDPPAFSRLTLVNQSGVQVEVVYLTSEWGDREKLPRFRKGTSKLYKIWNLKDGNWTTHVRLADGREDSAVVGSVYGGSVALRDTVIVTRSTLLVRHEAEPVRRDSLYWEVVRHSTVDTVARTLAKPNRGH